MNELELGSKVINNKEQDEGVLPLIEVGDQYANRNQRKSG